MLSRALVEGFANSSLWACCLCVRVVWSSLLLARSLAYLVGSLWPAPRLIQLIYWYMEFICCTLSKRNKTKYSSSDLNGSNLAACPSLLQTRELWSLRVKCARKACGRYCLRTYFEELLVGIISRTFRIPTWLSNPTSKLNLLQLESRLLLS